MIFLAGNNTEHMVKKFNEELNSLYSYLYYNKTCVNINKYKATFILRKVNAMNTNLVKNVEIKINNICLEYVEQFKYCHNRFQT